MIHLGEADLDTRLSISTHFIERWKERIDTLATGESIRKRLYNMLRTANEYPIDDLHYRVCDDGICVVLMRLSPLHSLAKTVYKKDESTLSAV